MAEHLHFGRAAQACHLSPSALTRTVQRLEEEVGAPLFWRDNRTVGLSETGVRFQAYARQAVSDWQNFKAELNTGAALSGSLSLYASITAVYTILPDLLDAYKRAWPAVQLDLTTGAAEDAVPRVQGGEVDLAVAALPDRLSTSCEFLPIVTNPLVFIAPKGAAPDPDRELDLREVPLVVPQTGLSRRRLRKWLKERHITPRISYEVSGNEAIIAMVRLGGGVGVVPRLVLEASPFREDVMVLPRAPELAPYVVGLCSTRRTLERANVKAFWNLAEEMTGKGD